MEEQTRLLGDVKRRNRRRGVLIAVIVIAVLGTLAYAAWYVYDDLLGNLGWDPGYRPAGYAQPEYEEPDPDFEALHDITDAASLNEFMRAWWYNGGDDTIRYSKDVVNVLLIGEDDDSEGISRSDTMMLCSVNKKTHRITLVSFLRDTYAYFKAGEDGEEEYYHRLNSALAFGGPGAVMDAISHLYKIRVDKYAAVNFRSFPKVIDALGGVVVDVEEKEARYINRTAPSMKQEFPFGEGVRLTGRQALVYSRIRKLDTDIMRTQRQQKVIESLVRSAKGAGARQLYRFLDELTPYVTTNYTKAQLMGLVPQALSWVNYGMDKASFPMIEGEATNAVTGSLRGMFLIITDYPLAAYQLQMALYGESNIDLETDAGRDEYIQSLFRAIQGWPPYDSDSQKQYTQAAEPDKPDEKRGVLDFRWPWQNPNAAPAEQVTQASFAEPPTEQATAWIPPAEDYAPTAETQQPADEWWRNQDTP